MSTNGLGVHQDQDVAYDYFKKSAEQNDDEGMFRFALFIRHLMIDSSETMELPLFQQLIEKSADRGNIEAIYHLGIYNESSYSGTEEIKKAFEYFRQAIVCGHIESLKRLVQLFSAIDNQSQFGEYSNYLLYSVGLFDIELMVNLIEYLNKQKEYEQAKI